MSSYGFVHTVATEYQNNFNKTLYKACEKGDLCMVQHIISRGLADIDYRGWSGQTSVMAAAQKGHFEVFDFLVSQECDLTVKSDYNDSVLHVACINGNMDIVRKLLDEEGIDKDVTGWHKWTPVMYAVYYGKKELFDLLVRKGCNVRAVNVDGNNILHLACHEGHTDIIHSIVSKQLVSIESRGQYGRTSVLTAARQGRKEVVKYLESRGCNMRSIDDRTNNILHMACLGGSVDMVKYILAQKIFTKESKGIYRQTPLMMAALGGNEKVFEFLVRRGCKLTAVNYFGETVLHLASRRGEVGILKLILAYGKNDIETKGYSGKTPVMVAAEKGKIKAVRLFVKKGCNMNTVDINGNNVLHFACMRGHVDVVKYLITLSDVEKNRKNKDGNTPQQEAMANGHMGITSLFFKSDEN